MSMKCSRCGKRFADIGAMGKHYRKAHPQVMAAKKKTKSKVGKSITKAHASWIQKGDRMGWL